MRSNEIGLRSQQLSEQTGARTADALSQQSEAWRHLPDVVTGFQRSYGMSQQIAQQAQAHQADMLKAGSELALDELRRKQAAEELQWAQQLHTTDMLQYQKEALKAETDLRIAQANKARAALEPDMGYGEYGSLDDERLASIVASTGTRFMPGHGGVTKVPATPKEIENANATLKSKRMERMMAHAQQAGFAGFKPDYESGEWKPMTPEERAEFAHEYQAAHSRFGDLGGLDDDSSFAALGAKNGAAAQAPPTGAISPETIKSDAYVDKLVTDFYSPGIAGRTVAIPNMDGSSFSNWNVATPDQKKQLVAYVRSGIQAQVAKHTEFHGDPARLRAFVQRLLESTTSMPEVIRIMHPQ